VTGRWGGDVALRIGIPAAIRRGRDLEIRRHQAWRAVEQRERFPVASFVSKDVLTGPDADDIDAQRFAQGLIDLREHLIRLMHARRRSAKPEQALLELVNDRCMNAGNPRPAKIDANVIRLLMVKGGAQSLARGHNVVRAKTLGR